MGILSRLAIMMAVFRLNLDGDGLRDVLYLKAR
jgi:ABC-type dipeptide/oligopeptide/nickel transport system permease subunit